MNRANRKVVLQHELQIFFKKRRKVSETKINFSGVTWKKQLQKCDCFFVFILFIE